MFNAIFLIGPQGMPVRLCFNTVEARDVAMLRFREQEIATDDLGQRVEHINGVWTVQTSDASDAAMNLAPHRVQIESEEAQAKWMEADPKARAYFMARRRQQMQMGQPQFAGPNGIPIIPVQ